MITETVRHIHKIRLLEYGMTRDWFEMWFDIDQDWKKEIGKYLIISELPSFTLLEVPNPDCLRIAFTRMCLDVQRTTIRDLDIDLPLVIKNQSPFSLISDEYFIFYEYLENNPIAKTTFLMLGHPEQYLQLRNASILLFSDNDASVFYDQVKHLFTCDTSYWYKSKDIYDMYVTEGWKQHE